MNISVLGFDIHPWASVERTRRFYESTLTAKHKLQPYVDFALCTSAPDALLDFAGGSIWKCITHPPCPVVLPLHGGLVINQQHVLKQASQLETSDVLLYNCRSDNNILLATLSNPMPVSRHITLPVNPPFTFEPDREYARMALPIRADFIIGYVGRILPQKNLHGWLRAFHRIKLALKPRRVCGLIIGDYWADYPVLSYFSGDYAEYIHDLMRQLHLSRDLTFLPGSLGDSDLAVCYRAMDILFHPTLSIDENFGYAPIEAMACGTPVVGNAYGGLKDTIVSGTTGYLVPTWTTCTGTRCDLLTAERLIVGLLRNRGLWNRMSLAAREHVLSKYSIERCARTLLSAFDGVSAQRSLLKARGKENSSRPLSDAAASLPPVKVPWSSYQKAVGHYVSDAVVMRRGSELYPSGPLTVQGRVIHLDDPAWPGVFALNTTERRLLLRCRRQPFVVPGTESSEVSTIAEKLVRLGALSFAAPEIYNV
jgi:glycosyltransferase involved in cell wall biosynthesis